MLTLYVCTSVCFYYCILVEIETPLGVARARFRFRVRWHRRRMPSAASAAPGNSRQIWPCLETAVVFGIRPKEPLYSRDARPHHDDVTPVDLMRAEVGLAFGISGTDVH